MSSVRPCVSWRRVPAFDIQAGPDFTVLLHRLHSDSELACLFENFAPNINKWQVDHDDDEAASVCTLNFFSSYSYHRGWPGQRDRARDKDRWLQRGCPCRMERRPSHSEGITPEHSIVINCSYLMALIRGYFPWGLSYNWNECNQIIRPRTIQFDLIRRFVAAEKFTLTWWRHRANICARCLGFGYTVTIITRFGSISNQV